MPEFAYRAYLPNGKHDVGSVDAETPQGAARELARRGLKPYHLAAVGSARALGLSSSKSLFSKSVDLGKLFSDLAVLLNAGFTIDRAIAAVIASEADASRRKSLQGILDLTTAGRSVAEAFSSLATVPTDVIALLASGERSGKLPLVCQRLAEIYEARAKRRSAIVSALAYPVFLLAVMGAALLVLALVLVPALEPIFEGASTPKPLTIRLLSGLGAAATEYPALFPLIAIIALLVFLMANRSANTKKRLLSWLLRTPLVGSLFKEATTARYLESLSLLLANGVAMTEALRLSTGTVGNSPFAPQLAQLENDVGSGNRLHEALDKSKMFNNSVVSLVTLGEDANSLPLMLERAARMQQTELSKRIENFLKLLTPTLTILLGILVGSLVISVMTTILSINDLALK
ncbi:type II secretion system F family protein [Mesorhizobium sp. 1M-11]|uniref:type II secretion system F family protein n=1 Tax=Mesorhizobium sp. 1M-11 TaxID=1529006 RepID=UPI0006C75752|nr:type II secretion system F family protein [Mesorhizobium sp. 1M-11]